MEQSVLSLSSSANSRIKKSSSSVSFNSDVEERVINARTPDSFKNELIRIGLDKKEGTSLSNPWVADHPALRQLSNINTPRRKKSPYNLPSGLKIFHQEVRLSATAKTDENYRSSSISPLSKYTVLPDIQEAANEWRDVTYLTARANKIRKAALESTVVSASVLAPEDSVPNVEEHILYGNTTHLPDIPTHTVKIYLSSGYADMKEERFSIHKLVVPKLRTYCKSLGLDFQLVDLHYCKCDDLADELTTYAVNQHEIDSCRQASIGPSFMTLIGDRYGAAIFPPQIEADEFELLLSYTEAECVPILEHWYRLDDNAAQPLYMLRLYESVDETDGTSIFQDTLWMVPELLYMAAFAAHTDGCLSDVRTSYYKKSDLEEDIDKGFVAADEPSKRCAVYMRHFKGLQSKLTEDFEQAKHYLDVDEDYQSLDQGSHALLQQLKNKIIPEQLSKQDIHTYALAWCGNGVDPSTQVEHTNYMYQLCMDIETDMRWLIQQAVTIFHGHDTNSLTSNVKEILQHSHHVNSNINNTVERKATLTDIKTHLRSALTLDHVPNSGHVPIVLYGDCGIGKSTAMALLHHSIPQWFGSDCVRVTRFVGLTPKSSNLLDLLLSTCEQISAIYGIHLPRDLDQKPIIKVAATFHKLLKKVSDLPLAFKRPLFILFDSLDSLSEMYNAHNPAWLPHTCSPHIYIVVSVTQQQHSIYTRLRTLFKKPDTFVKMDGFSQHSAAKLIDIYLASHNRTLTEEQRQTVINMSHHAGYSPMYMTLILSQAKTWNSLFTPSELQLGKTIPLAIAHIFDVLLEKHGTSFVSYALGYITVSKGGLSDTELEDVVSCNDTVLADLLQFDNAPRGNIVRLPSLLWRRLRYDLKDHLIERQRDGKTVVYWCHQQFVKAAHEKFTQSVWESKLHRGLLEIYSSDTGVCRTLVLKHGAVTKIADANRCITHQTLDVTNIRKLRLLPYHTQKSGSFEKVAHRLKSRVLCNWDFLNVKLKALGLKELLEDFTSLERTDSELTAVYEALCFLQQFRSHEERVANLALTLLEKLAPLTEKHHGLANLVTQAKIAIKVKGKLTPR